MRPSKSQFFRVKKFKKPPPVGGRLQLTKRHLFAAAGVLCVRRGNRIPCRVDGRSVDGLLATVELVASSEAYEDIAYFQHRTVQVELADLSLRVRVIGFNKCTRTVLLDALSFFRAIANALARRQNY